MLLFSSLFPLHAVFCSWGPRRSCSLVCILLESETRFGCTLISRGGGIVDDGGARPVISSSDEFGDLVPLSADSAAERFFFFFFAPSGARKSPVPGSMNPVKFHGRTVTVAHGRALPTARTGHPRRFHAAVLCPGERWNIVMSSGLVAPHRLDTPHPPLYGLDGPHWLRLPIFSRRPQEMHGFAVP